MRSPVTNTEYHTFLQRSQYEPKDRERFLQLWDHRDKEHVHEWIVPLALAQQPVVHVSLEDAQAFCAFYGLRLPHDWEWQYAASLSRDVDGNIWTKYPWGPLWNASQVPPKQRHYDALVDVGQYACTSYGVCDLMGVVWEFTDSFCDTHTCSVLLRGGSLYEPIASSQMDPNWYIL
jgi:iron(II)-dependent oxidoreductase